MDNLITHLSLCTGYGGIDHGLGTVLPTLRTVGYVEIEAFAIANLVTQMEKGLLDTAPIYTDLRGFDGVPYCGKVSILSAGFSCQPFSLNGKRESTEDERFIWPSVDRVIGEVQPSAVFLENVPGIISSRVGGIAQSSVLHDVLRRLEGRGYTAAWGVFSAEEVNLPHKRERVFILAVADPNGSGGGEDSEPSEPRTESTIEPPSNSRSHRPAQAQQVPRRPAGPGQEQHDWEEPRTVERGVGGAVDGTSRFKHDRLRMLGNGVVPAQAAHAWVTLAQELYKDAHHD